MEERGIKILRDFMWERIDLALEKSKQNLRYIERCTQQVESKKLADAVLEKMEKEDRITIRRLYEDETAKNAIEMEEIYIQGLKDCAKLFSVLGVSEAFGTKVEL